MSKGLFRIILLFLGIYLSTRLFTPIIIKASDPVVRDVRHFTFSGDPGEYGTGETGDCWDGEHYYLPDGTMARDVFFCDGIHTFYLQFDGTPMKSRLSYHPDGVHIIYFDEFGWEQFNDFAFVEYGIMGETVRDLFFFGTDGYMRFDCLTWGPKESYYSLEYMRGHCTTVFGQPYDYSDSIFHITPFGNVQREGLFQYEDGSYGYCHQFWGIPYGIVFSSSDIVVQEDGTIKILEKKLDKPVYIGIDRRFDAERTKQIENCSVKQLDFINEFITYDVRSRTLVDHPMITPNGYDLHRYMFRVFNYLVSCGTDESQAWDIAHNQWRNEIEEMENGEFYLLRSSKEDFDRFMCDVYGEWILDPIWEFQLLD